MTEDLHDDPQEELASLYAFDLLEGAEKTAFEASLARDPELREKVRQLRESAADLAYTAPQVTPPQALKARLMHSVEARSAKGAPVRMAPVVRFPILPWALAAGFAVAAIWLGHLYHAAASDNLRLRALETSALADLETSRSEMRSSQDLARYKIATLASMLGNSPQALAVAVWDPSRQRGVFTVSRLPAAGAGKDYQLWVIDPDYKMPVSGGTFAVDSATGHARIIFTADKTVKTPAKFAVSLERKGGAAPGHGPAGPIVLLSQ